MKNETLDTRLVDALLTEHHRPQQEIDQQIDKAMAAIDALEPTAVLAAKPRIKHRRNMAWTSIAASIFVCIGLFFISSPSNTAYASIDQLVRALQKKGDRRYTIHLDKVKGQKKQNTLSHGLLYLRDTHHFVLEGTRFDGTTFIKGKNAVESWQLSHRRDQLKTGEPNDIKLPISGHTRPLIFIDLATTLKALKSGYKVSVTKLDTNEHPEYSAEESLSMLVANKITRDTKGPRSVNITFHTDTFELKKMIFDRVHIGSEKVRARVTLSLSSTETIPDIFFDGEFHFIPTPRP